MVHLPRFVTGRAIGVFRLICKFSGFILFFDCPAARAVAVAETYFAATFAVGLERCHGLPMSALLVMLFAETVGMTCTFGTHAVRVLAQSSVAPHVCVEFGFAVRALWPVPFYGATASPAEYIAVFC